MIPISVESMVELVHLLMTIMINVPNWYVGKTIQSVYSYVSWKAEFFTKNSVQKPKLKKTHPNLRRWRWQIRHQMVIITVGSILVHSSTIFVIVVVPRRVESFVVVVVLMIIVLLLWFRTVRRRRQSSSTTGPTFGFAVPGITRQRAQRVRVRRPRRLGCGDLHQK